MVIAFVKEANQPVDFVPGLLAEAPYRFKNLLNVGRQI
jgi:hypothetical protein